MVLSIIITSWNTIKYLQQCIESLKAVNSDTEIIVIDNNSTDGSKEWLRTQKHIILIENNENLGYAAACNQGIKIAKGSFVLLLGSDTIVHDTSVLGKCIEFLKSKPDAGAVSCKLLNPDGSTQNSIKRFPKLINGFYTYLSLDLLNKHYDMADFTYDRTIEIEQADSTFLMIKKEVLALIKGFDERYRILYNDVDLCRRILNTGYKIYFLHTCSITHYGSTSTRRADFRVRKIMYGDIYRYYRNNFGYKALFLYPILAVRLLLVSTIKP
jgi:GT2 family glycosyltransferase